MTTRQDLAVTVRRTILPHLKRRSINEPAPEGTMALVDNGTAERWGNKREIAYYRNGWWAYRTGRELPFEPTIWVEWQP